MLIALLYVCTSTLGYPRFAECSTCTIYGRSTPHVDRQAHAASSIRAPVATTPAVGTARGTGWPADAPLARPRTPHHVDDTGRPVAQHTLMTRAGRWRSTHDSTHNTCKAGPQHSLHLFATPHTASQFADLLQANNIVRKREVSHRAFIGNTYTARASNIKGVIVYFIVIQLVATAALLVGHLAVVIRNQLVRPR